MGLRCSTILHCLFLSSTAAVAVAVETATKHKCWLLQLSCKGESEKCLSPTIKFAVSTPHPCFITSHQARTSDFSRRHPLLGQLWDPPSRRSPLSWLLEPSKVVVSWLGLVFDCSLILLMMLMLLLALLLLLLLLLLVEGRHGSDGRELGGAF